MSATKLVIVESPAKAATIEGYLGPDYHVTASIGHIRDLPQPSELPKDMKKGPFGRFAVNVDDGFKPYYVVNPDKKKKVTELKKLLKESDELYLATDEDREGEAIAWHLLQVLKPKVPVRRMVFHEITKEAIQRALENTRDLDTDLVDAQETRRILDRLYGYEVSPLLWRKIRPSLSAGRVQSVATRLVVARERDRMAHVSAQYWSIDTAFTSAGQAFGARVSSVDGHPIATGSDFSEKGELSAKATKAGVLHLDEATARLVRPRAVGRPGLGHRLGDPQALPSPPGRPLHDVDTPAGGVAQAALERVLDDAHRPVPVRVRLHHLHAYRLHGAVRARRFTPPASRPRSSTGPRPWPTPRACTAPPRRAPRRRTRPSVPPAITSARPVRLLVPCRSSSWPCTT